MKDFFLILNNFFHTIGKSGMKNSFFTIVGKMEIYEKKNTICQK